MYKELNDRGRERERNCERKNIDNNIHIIISGMQIVDIAVFIEIFPTANSHPIQSDALH